MKWALGCRPLRSSSPQGPPWCQERARGAASPSPRPLVSQTGQQLQQQQQQWAETAPGSLPGSTREKSNEFWKTIKESCSYAISGQLSWRNWARARVLMLFSLSTHTLPWLELQKRVYCLLFMLNDKGVCTLPACICNYLSSKACIPNKQLKKNPTSCFSPYSSSSQHLSETFYSHSRPQNPTPIAAGQPGPVGQKNCHWLTRRILRSDWSKL